MKGKFLVGLLLSTSMMLQVAASDVVNPNSVNTGDAITNAAGKVLWNTFKDALPMPDDLNATTGTIAGVTAVAGTALFFGADYLCGLSAGKVGEWITKATWNNIGGSDLLKGIALWGGAMGLTTMYKNGPEWRKTITSATVANGILHQLQTPGVIEPGEFTTIAQQAILGIAALSRVKDILPWIGIGK